MLRPIAIGTLIAGVLDILFAITLTLMFGRDVGGMLRFVASGPFPAATQMGDAGALLGLIVHFTLMSVMAAAYVFVATRMLDLVRRPLPWGVAYGLLTYVAMNLILVPLRFPAAWPPKPISIGTQLFAHIVLVGLVLAFVTARTLKGSSTSAQGGIRVKADSR